MTTGRRRLSGLVLFAAFALAAVGHALFPGRVIPAGILAYLFLVVGSGAVLFLLLAPRLPALELLLAALATGPVLVVAGGLPLMLAGLDGRSAAAILLALVAGLGAWALRPSRPVSIGSAWPPSRIWVLAATLVGVALIVGVLPLSQAWWRVRADAWFHGAVVAEIADFGLPPHDPYFMGLPLQYMWLYHVLVLLLSRASAISPQVVMPLLNVQAICAFALAAFLFSSVFRKGFAAPFWSLLTAVFGMNALFWLFLLPFVAARSFTGEVHGLDEATRLLSLHPFSADRIRQLLHVHANQEFLLDKFLVSTALSLGLASMAALWYGAVRYLEEQSPRHLVLAFLATVGTVGFHPLTGALAAGGVLGGLFLLFLRRRGVEGYRLRPSVAVAGAVILAVLVLAPYIFSISHAKEEEQLLPFSLSADKLIGLVISLALVAWLAARQVRRLLRSSGVASSFLAAAILALLLISLVVQMPGRNTGDKLPFLLFFPLAVAAGWTLAEFTGRGRRALRAVVVFLLAFGPLNGLALAAYYSSSPQPALTPAEEDLAAWVRGNTPRDAVFFDSKDRVILLVPGPRRYYWGIRNYAEQWGYDEAEMDRRRHVRDTLFSSAPLDSATVTVLGTMPVETYVIARRGEPDTAGPAKFESYPDLFDVVFSTGDLFLFQVDRSACRAASRDPGVLGRPELTGGP